MKIIANNGETIEVDDSHPLLEIGVFKVIDYQKNSQLDIDFLIFVFQGITDNPIEHAKMASMYYLKDLARETFLLHIEKIDSLCEISRELLTLDFLSDEHAARLLITPSSDDLTKIVEKEYFLCYKKFANIMGQRNYKFLRISFTELVLETIGIDETFVVCCVNGHLSIIKHMILTNRFNKELYISGLEIAAVNGHLEVVKYLLSLNDGFCVGLRKGYILGLIIDNGHVDMARYWIGLEADGWYFNLSLSHAIKKDNIEMVKLLISAGGMVRQNDLVTAAKNGNISMMQYLLSLGNEMADGGDRALSEAAYSGHIEMVEFLVSIGADPRADDDTAVINAAGNGNFEMVDYLMSLGADVRNQDDLALIMAAQNGKIEMVNFLISLGADVRNKNNIALAVAVQNEQIEMVKFLISHGARVTRFGTIQGAAEKESPEILKLLIPVCDTEGGFYEALKCAVELGRFEAVKILVGVGVDVNQYDNHLIRTALGNGSTEIAEFLVLNGRIPEDEDEAIYLLTETIKHKNTRIMQLLISAGINPRAKNNYAIEFAADLCYYDMIKYLLTLGAGPESSLRPEIIAIIKSQVVENFLESLD